MTDQVAPARGHGAFAPITTARTLSKSDFKLARSCAAKLYFRENRYPDNSDSNAYLALLARGGYMVEALAKAHYPDAIQLEYGRDIAADHARTLEYLERDNVTLFEATLVAGKRHARVDILQKQGNVVRLLEVKSSLVDGAEHFAALRDGERGVFQAKRKPHRVLNDWRDYLEDITYQALLLEKALPGVDIRPHLVLLDSCKRADVDDIPRLFEIVNRTGSDGVTRLHTARYVGSNDQLVHLDLVTEIDVTEEVAMLRAEVEEAAALFEARLDAPLSTFTLGLERTSKCAKCEFRGDPPTEPDGFSDCWGSRAVPKPHMLELFSIGTTRALDRRKLIQTLFDAGTVSLFDIPLDALVNADGNVGPQPERQRRQIEYTRDNKIYVGSGLRAKIDGLTGPLHFIDFETSRLALPYHARMRPYGVVTFQWSCHQVRGETLKHSEWLNTEEIWPNQTFAESLRAAIGDEGPVLTWSHFEASTLKEIVRDLQIFGRDTPELVQWMTDVFERRIVDMHQWAQREYYHPGMKGRTSIKVVLDALWRSDPALRAQFEALSGLKADPGRDLYTSLPPVEINGVMQDVHEGTGAMRAYEEMMYGADRKIVEIRNRWAGLLKQYCKLDTLSMVLILEHWRRVVRS